MNSVKTLPPDTPLPPGWRGTHGSCFRGQNNNNNKRFGNRDQVVSILTGISRRTCSTGEVDQTYAPDQLHLERNQSCRRWCLFARSVGIHIIHTVLPFLSRNPGLLMGILIKRNKHARQKHLLAEACNGRIIRGNDLWMRPHPQLFNSDDRLIWWSHVWRDCSSDRGRPDVLLQRDVQSAECL